MIPNLALNYIRAQQEIYNQEPWMQGSYYNKFREQELKLMEHNIPLDEYAVVVSLSWMEFVFSKDMTFVPINMFLSNYSLELYNRYLSQSTVKLKFSRSKEEYHEMYYMEKSFMELYVMHLMSDEEVKMSEQEFIDWCTNTEQWSSERFFEWLVWQKEKIEMRQVIQEELIHHNVGMMPKKFSPSKTITTYNDYYEILKNYHYELDKVRNKFNAKSKFERLQRRMLKRANQAE